MGRALRSTEIRSPPGCDVSYKTQFKNLQKYFLINGQPITKVQYSYQSLVIAGQARILQNRVLVAVLV